MSKNKFNGTIASETGQGNIGAFSFEGKAGDRPGPIECTLTVQNPAGGAPEQKIFSDKEKETLPAGPVKGRLAVQNIVGDQLAEVVFSENLVQTRIGGGELENHVGRLKADDGQLPGEMAKLAGLVANNQSDPAAMRKALLTGLGVEFKEKPGPARAEPKQIIPTPRPAMSAADYRAGKGADSVKSGQSAFRPTR